MFVKSNIFVFYITLQVKLMNVIHLLHLDLIWLNKSKLYNGQLLTIVAVKSFKIIFLSKSV